MAGVTRIGPGVYLVRKGEGDDDHGHDIVYIAGSRGNTWAFCNGTVYRPAEPAQHAARPRVAGAVQFLTAPMPATIVTVLATPGQAVKAGDTLVIVEAMKMELPVRAPADALVRAVRCKDGDIVQSDQTLIELE